MNTLVENNVVNEMSNEINISCKNCKEFDDFSEKNNIDFKNIVAQVLQYINIADLTNKIEKGVEYVVEIPKEFQGGFKAGDYWLMENKDTGKAWPTLMKLNENGRNEIVTPLAVKKEEILKNNLLDDLTNNYNNILIQQTLNDITYRLDKAIDAIHQVELGQKDDRIGLLEAGRQDLVLALKQKDILLKKIELSNARSKISESQNKFFATLDSKISQFKPLPSNKFILTFKETITPDSYIEKKADMYNEIVDYYRLFIESTKLLSASYLIVGDNDNAHEVLNIAKNMLQKFDYGNLQTIEYAYPNGDYDKIYDGKIQRFDSVESLIRDTLIDSNYLSITIKGEDLLEVASNEQ